MGRQLLRRPRMFMTPPKPPTSTHDATSHAWNYPANKIENCKQRRPAKSNSATHERGNQSRRNPTTHSDNQPNNLGAKAGATVGNVLETKKSSIKQSHRTKRYN